MLWLLMGYVFLIVYRPFEVWPVLGPLRIELLYMLGAGAIWLVAPNKRFPATSLVGAVLGMVAAVVLCCLASPWAEECLESVDWWLKLQVFFLMLITVVQDEVSLKRLLGTVLVVMALYMLHSLWEFHCGRYVSRMGINRMVGIDSTNGDPNAFATNVLLSLIFVPVFWKTCQGPIRWLLAGYGALAVLCISFTGSRAGFVGLIIFLVVTAWRSEWRMKVLLALVLLAPAAFLALPEPLQNRFETIINPAAGPANARTSADARREGFELGMRLWHDNLLTGVGPGAWRAATGRKLQSHNLYGQLAGEMGTLGVLAFGGLLLAYAINIRLIRRAYQAHPEWQPDFLAHVTSAVSLGIALLLFAGLAGHNLFRPHWVLYAAFLIIVRRQVADRMEAAAAGWGWDAESAWEDEGAMATMPS
jgi:hypothetical protein